jgi:hypothetical protein
MTNANCAMKAYDIYRSDATRSPEEKQDVTAEDGAVDKRFGAQQ